MTIVVHPGGVMRCLYCETIDLGSLGALQVSRASHVEPDAQGQWWADLHPVKGPLLGPYTLRSQALKAEEEWLMLNQL